MKRYVLTALALSTIMTCSSIPAFAQQATTNTQQTTQNTTPERFLTYGKIQSITYEGDTLQSITAKDAEGYSITYQINEQTKFLDSGKKMKVNSSTLKEGDAVYFYHTLTTQTVIPKPISAEAIITNIPMDTSCAKLHTVEEITINKNGTVTITSEQGSIKLTTENDVVIKDYDTNNTLQISDIQIGQRFFTWYNAVAESYPAQATIKQIITLPITEPVEQIAYEDTIKEKNKVTYQKETLPVVNGVSFVPLRETATKLGLSVTWDAKNRVTKLESDTRSVNLIEGNDYYISSTTIKSAVGMTAPQKLGAAPFIDKTNVMYVPAEAFRVLVGYDVTITDSTVTIAKQQKK